VRGRSSIVSAGLIWLCMQAGVSRADDFTADKRGRLLQLHNRVVLSFNRQEVLAPDSLEADEQALKELGAASSCSRLDVQAAYHRAAAIVFLASGDPQKAGEHVTRLTQLLPHEPATLYLRFAAAAAAGDKHQADECLQIMADTVGGEHRQWVLLKQQHMQMVGQPAPNIEGFRLLHQRREFNLEEYPNAVLVADFWAWYLAPSAQYFQDVLNLHRALRDDIEAGRVVMVGVNRDAPRHRSKAEEMLRGEQLDRPPDTWPHVRENREYDCPITNQGYRVQGFPWTVVADRGRDRRVRYVGTPSDPLLQYAIRAALQPNAVPTPAVETPLPPYQFVDQGNAIRNRAAEDLLEEVQKAYEQGDPARARQRADQVLRDYPNTISAFSARRLLDVLEEPRH
jgi:hypothetical protein